MVNKRTKNPKPNRNKHGNRKLRPSSLDNINSSILYKAVALLLHAGDDEEVWRLLCISSGYDENNVDLYRYRCRLYLFRDNIEFALEDAELGLELAPQDPDLHGLKIACYVMLKMNYSADTHLQKCLKDFPSQKEYIMEYRKLSWEFLNKATNEATNTNDSWFDSFWLLVGFGTHTQPTTPAKRSPPLFLEKTNVPVGCSQKELAVILQDLAKNYAPFTVAGRLVTVSKALDYDPENIDLYFLRSMYYLYFENVESALQDVETGLKLDKDNVGLICRKATCYMLSGNSSKADELFEMALSLDPSRKDWILKNKRSWTHLLVLRKRLDSEENGSDVEPQEDIVHLF